MKLMMMMTTPTTPTTPTPAEAPIDAAAGSNPPDGPARLRLSLKGEYDPASDTLYCGHSAGFFSSCCVTLWNLEEVQRTGRTLPGRIDFSRAFASFRNAPQVAAATDLYPQFFQPGMDAAAALPRLPRINHHGIYRLLDYRRINPVMTRYFAPSAAAREWQARLLQRYRIDPATTLAVVYRGTDKGTEVRVASPEAYLALTRKLLTRHPGFRVWIQTDELAVRQMFCREFGERCFFLHEMPVSIDGRVVHQQDDDTLKMERSDFGVLLVAVNSLLAQCRLVVNHTGNMALWLCLFRGHAMGVWQFDDEGRAVNPSAPGCWFGAARRFRIKAVRKILRALGLRRD